MATMTYDQKPRRACLFAEGQLVTCAGPFNSGRDERGYWRRVERVAGIRWEPGFRSGRRYNFGQWRVVVPGYFGIDVDYAPAPEGSEVGDIIRLN
jgi:hypothetical protein